MSDVEEIIRPDPQRGEPAVEATSAIPAHEPDAVVGTIQHKEHPDGPILERALEEQDLQEGKVSPQAVEKPKYDFGVTHDDIEAGKVSMTAARQSDPVLDDADLAELITVARNRTQLARLNPAELAEVFASLKAAGFEVRKV